MEQVVTPCYFEWKQIEKGYIVDVHFYFLNVSATKNYKYITVTRSQNEKALCPYHQYS